MKTYSFTVGGSLNAYGTGQVEADTLEEAKQKIFEEKLYHDVSLDPDGDVNDLRIVDMFECDEYETMIPGGEYEDCIDIPGEVSEYQRGFEDGKQAQVQRLSILYAMVSVSTAHIKPTTNAWLVSLHPSSKSFPFFGGPTQNGFLIHCDEEPGEDCPQEIANMMRWARERFHADYILLDSDGQEHTELETFEWN